MLVSSVLVCPHLIRLSRKCVRCHAAMQGAPFDTLYSSLISVSRVCLSDKLIIIIVLCLSCSLAFQSPAMTILVFLFWEGPPLDQAGCEQHPRLRLGNQHEAHTLKMLTVSFVSFTSSTHSLSETGLKKNVGDCARECPHLLYLESHYRTTNVPIEFSKLHHTRIDRFQQKVLLKFCTELNFFLAPHSAAIGKSPETCLWTPAPPPQLVRGAVVPICCSVSFLNFVPNLAPLFVSSS